ncbi:MULTISPECIES: hypothetical protein [Sorangium]
MRGVGCLADADYSVAKVCADHACAPRAVTPISEPDAGAGCSVA